LKNYYSQRLSAERLKLCYDVATPRVKKYLKEELNFVLGFIQPGFSVLELGCGYGRVFGEFESKAKNIYGVDTSIESLQMGKQIYKKNSSVFFLQMNAAQAGFKNESFDLVFCIQNGISAFKEEPVKLIKEAIRLAKKTVLFSFQVILKNSGTTGLSGFVFNQNKNCLVKLMKKKQVTELSSAKMVLKQLPSLRMIFKSSQQNFWLNQKLLKLITQVYIV
jgi:ubiquinone/menaquinone biosynthesis C-methylase UbiE